MYEQMIFGLARNTDPETSKAAAASFDATTLIGEVYLAMRSYGHSGATSDQIVHDLGIERNQSITPRFRQMLDRGMIELTGETRKASSGRQQNVMRVLPQPFTPVKRQAKTDWKPIETAPKDGTAILGWDGCCMTTVNWQGSLQWQLVECGSYADDGDWYPTHWMPLPDPPTK